MGNKNPTIQFDKRQKHRFCLSGQAGKTPPGERNNAPSALILAILSYCGALSLSMRFAAPALSAEQQVSPLGEVFWNLRGSLSGTGLSATLLFAGLMALGVSALRQNEKIRPPRALLLVSFTVSLVWLMGASFSIDNTLEALDASPGQIVKSICYVLGMTYLLCVLSWHLFHFLQRQKPQRPHPKQGRLARLYNRHPFGAAFFAILLFWSPYLIVAYPGYMCHDAWSQLAQCFGVMDFSAHHPPVHTLMLGMSVRLGLRFGSGSLGLYLFIVAQALVEAGVFAYSLFIMRSWETPRWLRLGSFGVVIAMPYYIGYVAMVLKDNLYAAMVVLFVIECICMLQEKDAFFSHWHHRLLFPLSILGTILFRHNGKYILYPTLLCLLVYFCRAWWSKGQKKDLAKVMAAFLLPVLLANMLVAAVTAQYGFKEGSIGEALSLPFQQTARYVLERPNEVTEEEAQAIGAVLDYAQLAEKYDPRISDPVKALFDSEASNDALFRYFSAWFQMFLKHPEIYVKATMNQNYYLIYPFTQNSVLYVSTFPSAWFVDHTNEKLGISVPEGLLEAKTVANDFYRALFSLPVIGLLSHQAPYTLLLIALLVFAVSQKRFEWLLACVPLLLSCVVVVLSPVIQGHPRYAFPIIYSMPIMLAYYIHFGQSKESGKRS